MTVTPHLTPIKDDALHYKAEAPGHTDPWYGEYCGMAGWLLITGADITPATTLVSRGLGHVTPDHEDAAEHLLGYIHAHADLGLTFNRRKPPPDRIKLLQYVDAAHGRNRKTGHSDEGQATLLNGNLVSWYFKGQTIVAANPYEAEVIAFANGTRQLNKLRNYIIGCGEELGPTPVFEDNTSVVRYARDIGLARASRTLAQHFHYGRDQQHLGLVDVRTVPGEDNLADFFTKPLGKTNFQLNVARLGMRSVAECTLASARLASTGVNAGG